MAPESDLVQKIVSNDQMEAVTEFVQRLQSMNGTKRSEQAGTSKEGQFLGAYAVHPLTGKKIPIYVADYVIADFAEGCVMGVPAHDNRDFEFAKKHNLDVITVIQPEEHAETARECYTGSGRLINSEAFDGQNNIQAKKSITDHAQKLSVGSETIQYKIRDWLVSRQRYWYVDHCIHKFVLTLYTRGAPIPIIHCPQCGVSSGTLDISLTDLT